MRQNKTGRKRGEVYMKILTTPGVFDIYGVPGLTAKQVDANGRQLWQQGRLKLVRPATMGRNAQSVIYQVA